MIEINLLPLELREKKKVVFEQFFKTRSAFIILGILILLHALMHILFALNGMRLSKLEKSWQGLSEKREQIAQLNREVAKFDREIPLIEQLIETRILWSEKLNRISDLIINGIWLNEVVLEKQKARARGGTSEHLMIRGSAASRTKDEPALIGRFMQNLKDDSIFSADFVEIELGPIKKRQIAQTEVMDFVFICRFK
ncbi:MAG: hypothetical protein NG712_01395 [Omnitrophica bacterium]|nr:hypothetical protein [Candidatus Omnitrophota bacterium]